MFKDLHGELALGLGLAQGVSFLTLLAQGLLLGKAATSFRS